MPYLAIGDSNWEEYWIFELSGGRGGKQVFTRH